MVCSLLWERAPTSDSRASRRARSSAWWPISHLGFSGDGDVEVVRQPAPRECGVAGLLVEAVAAEPEGVVDRDPLGAKHGERVAKTRGGLGVARGRTARRPSSSWTTSDPSLRLRASSAMPPATSPWARRTSPSLVTALPVVGERHHGGERAVAEPEQLGTSERRRARSAERTRWFFSKMTRSPTLKALAPILISAPSSPAAWRRARTMSFRAATSARRTARMAVVWSRWTLHQSSTMRWRAASMVPVIVTRPCST